MDCKEIIIEKLKEIGADGLCCEDCGCGIDDLFLCDTECTNCLDCVPAKKSKRHAEYETFVPLEEI